MIGKWLSKIMTLGETPMLSQVDDLAVVFTEGSAYMLRGFSRAGIACATMSFVIAVSVAIAAPSPAQLFPSLASRSATVYRLSPAAAYTQGCFPPALCPTVR
jgi:hypothetical protein